MSIAQNSGSQRSLSGPARLARWAELTTSTAWNLNPTRPRLDVPHARQEQRRQHVAVRQPLLDPRPHLFKQLLARRLFEQPDERLDARIEADEIGVELGVGGGDEPASYTEKGERAGGEGGRGTGNRDDRDGYSWLRSERGESG